MTLDTWIGIAGTTLGVVSLVYAIIQGIRLHDVRRRANADIWFAIRTVRSITTRLEETELPQSNAIIGQVYGKSVELFCHLLKEAVLSERRFSEATIRRWKAAGKLTTEWQVAQARHFLDTDHIDDVSAPASPRNA